VRDLVREPMEAGRSLSCGLHMVDHEIAEEPPAQSPRGAPSRTEFLKGRRRTRSRYRGCSGSWLAPRWRRTAETRPQSRG
jgi:hypothetical protein